MTRLLSVLLPLATLAAQTEPVLRLVRQHPDPVITTRHPDASSIRYGFEGGRVVKAGGVYHLFTSEMIADPIWCRMRLGYWTSRDGLQWSRQATIRESSGEFEGKDPRAALWSPLPVWDDGERRWNLFYVAYRSAPSTATQFLLNHAGEIWRAVSETPGEAGIRGPYRDIGIVMKPGRDSDPWEGLQGTDSFFPYRAGTGWTALYGSAKTEVLPIRSWLVGLAAAPSLAGPWKRLSARNPAPIEKVFIENPIVTPLPGGGFLAVYDSQEPDTIGHAYSPDGLDWRPGKRLIIQPRAGSWSADVRTPLGLVPEGGGEYTIFYTGFEAPPDWDALLKGNGGSARCAVGRATVRIERPQIP